jgi:hypothetical protein
MSMMKTVMSSLPRPLLYLRSLTIPQVLFEAAAGWRRAHLLRTCVLLRVSQTPSEHNIILLSSPRFTLKEIISGTEMQHLAASASPRLLVTAREVPFSPENRHQGPLCRPSRLILWAMNDFRLPLFPSTEFSGAFVSLFCVALFADWDERVA